MEFIIGGVILLILSYVVAVNVLNKLGKGDNDVLGIVLTAIIFLALVYIAKNSILQELLSRLIHG